INPAHATILKVCHINLVAPLVGINGINSVKRSFGGWTTVPGETWLASACNRGHFTRLQIDLLDPMVQSVGHKHLLVFGDDQAMRMVEDCLIGLLSLAAKRQNSQTREGADESPRVDS